MGDGDPTYTIGFKAVQWLGGEKGISPSIQWAQDWD
jgi:hypothetical protein